MLCRTCSIMSKPACTVTIRLTCIDTEVVLGIQILENQAKIMAK